MIIGTVVGNVVSTRKEDGLMGYKLLVVEPLPEYNQGKRIVAIDRVGAGIQNEVLVATGSSARLGLSREDVPVDAAIVGIID